MCKTPGIHFPERMMDSVYDTEMGEKGGFCIHTGWAARFEFWPGRNLTMHNGDPVMKSNNYLIGLSILFFVLAAAFSVVFWADVSLVAKIGFFVLGFGSGVTAGQWFARRSA